MTFTVCMTVEQAFGEVSVYQVCQQAAAFGFGKIVLVFDGNAVGRRSINAGLDSGKGVVPGRAETDRLGEKLIKVAGATERGEGVLVAVSEGIHYADGSFVSEAKTSATDGFGHAQLGGLATLLAEVVKNKMGCKVRGVELSLLQRCGAHLASATDIREAQAAGAQAVKAALDGITDKMVAFERSTDENGNYVCGMKLIPLSDVANYEKKVPLEWINDTHNGVKKEFIDYVLPLIQGEPELPREHSLPRYAKLKKVLAK